MSMELATTITANESLVECLMQAKVMCELVDSFAATSKTLLRANELDQEKAKAGKKRAVKMGANGSTHAIWDVDVIEGTGQKNFRYSDCKF